MNINRELKFVYQVTNLNLEITAIIDLNNQETNKFYNNFKFYLINTKI